MEKVIKKTDHAENSDTAAPDKDVAQKTKSKATVALVRSAREKAEQITEAEIRQMVRDTVEFAGGLSDIVKDGQFVVIKPNLISVRSLTGLMSTMTMLMTDPYSKKSRVPTEVNGLTSDWRVAKALVELVREINPSGKVYIMECSGEGQVKETFEILGYTHENIPGVDKFVGLDETGDGHRAVNSKDLVAVKLKEKQQYKKLPKYLKNKYYFDKTYYSADVVISLSCLKNHMNAAVTGGIKNVGIGVMPGKIYGSNKKTINRSMTIDHGWEGINNYIHDYYMAKPVQFVLTDGLQGLAYGPQGQGSPNYEKCKMNMRLLLASKDPVACDAIHSCIVGVDPQRVNYIKDLSRDGYGVIDTAKITIVGNARVDEVKKRFPMPKGTLRFMYSGPSKTRYEDFAAPEVAVENVVFIDNTVKAELKTSEKTTKVELHIDGKLVETFVDEFDAVCHTPKEALQSGSHEVKFYAYDKYLNCGHMTSEVTVS